MSVCVQVQCLTLANQIKEQTEPGLILLQERVVESRRKIADELRISPENALQEEGYNPDVELEQARQQLAAVRASLDFGGIESARESMDALAIDVSGSERFVESSLACIEGFAAHVDQAKKLHEQLTEGATQQNTTVEQARARFASSALIFQGELSDGAGVQRSNKTLDGLLSQGSDVFKECRPQLWTKRLRCTKTERYCRRRILLS